MSATPKDGGPAFPHPELVQDICGEDGHVKAHRVYHAMPGMTLRDLFAAAALIGLLTQRQEVGDAEGTSDAVEDGQAGIVYPGGYISIHDQTDAAARDAYSFADAMLAEREMGGGQ